MLISNISCKSKRFDTQPPIPITLPHSFRTEKAEHFSIEAFQLRKEHKYVQAIESYRQALKVEPDNPRLYFDLSECYTSTGKLEEAILLLDTAIRLDNSYAGFYNNRGLIYWKLDKNSKAIEDYKKAISLDSTNWVFHSNIAMVYYSENKIPEACRAFQMAKYLGLNMSGYKGKDNLEILSRICH